MKHRIPREPIVEIITQYLEEHPDISEERLSYSLGMSKGYIRNLTIGTRRRKPYKTMEFETADQILCKLNKVYLWYEPPLDYYYWEGNIPPDGSKPCQCNRRNCDNWFSLEYGPNPNGAGERVFAKLFCSSTCADMESRYRTERTVPRDLYCRNKHPRTEENTEHLKNGKIRCKICSRERTKEYRQRNGKTKARHRSTKEVGREDTNGKGCAKASSSKEDASRPTTRKVSR